ncbi:glycosyltransferase family 2 protein [Nocardioides insulae]|uniref:glycosyltransferase family 2 protein n=1 Tax=Nocardioides insulae TaxID=394734 RepID=UPI00041629AD|nr:glycosyltransferase family 2 protein [Nocardioides insulae]
MTEQTEVARSLAEPIDVVVVTYRSRHVIDALLDSLPDAMGGLPARVVVVDNGSPDGTADHVAARGDCLVVRAPNRGYAAGINAGVAALAGHGPILVLNPDVRLGANSVPALFETLCLPDTGIAAPRVLDDQGALFPSLGREPTLPRALGLNRTGLPWLTERIPAGAAYEEPRRVDWALGAVLLISRECHDRLGWDESFFLYSEETDLCLRARDAGLATRYDPRAVCWHVGGQSGRSARIHAMQVLNRLRLYRRRHSVPAACAYLAALLASEVSWVLRGQDFSREAIRSLLRPRRRPAELDCSDSLLPR